MQFIHHMRFKKKSEVKENLGNLKDFADLLSNPKISSRLLGGRGTTLGPNSPADIVASITIPDEVTPGRPNVKASENWGEVFDSVQRALKKASRADNDDKPPLAIGIFSTVEGPEFLLVRATLGGSGAGYGNDLKQWNVYGINGEQVDTERQHVFDRREARHAYKLGRQYTGHYYDAQIRQKFLKDWTHTIAAVLAMTPGVHKFVAIYGDPIAAAKRTERLQNKIVTDNPKNLNVGFKMAEPYLEKIREKTIGAFTKEFDAYEVAIKNSIVNGEASRYGSLPKSALPQIDPKLFSTLFYKFSGLAAAYNELQSAKKGSYTYENALKAVKERKEELEKLLNGV